MKITDKYCPFRKFERKSSTCDTRDEEFQYCLGEKCMACIELENGAMVCGLIVKPILHQEVEVV
jgi:hypothetical protein